MNPKQIAELPQWRRDWLVRHLWREGVGRTGHEAFLILQNKVRRISGDGPNWWRVWIWEGGDFDVRRVRADKRWDFDALIRHG